MKEKWERFTHLIDEYENDKSLLEPALNMEIKSQKKPVRMNKKWLLIGIISVCVLFAVAIPVYLSLRPKPPVVNYYDEKNVELSQIEDLPKFILDNNLNIKCLELQNCENRKAEIIETKELGYLIQNGFYISDAGFDQVKLFIVIAQNSKFSFANNFKELNNECEINGSLVRFDSEFKMNQNIIKVWFKHGETEYYINITTYGDVEAKIDYYVKQLIKD